MKVTLIDPPSGWMYGFPRVYDRQPGQTLESWLEEKGYPKSMIPLAIKYSRYWESDFDSDEDSSSSLVLE